MIMNASQTYMKEYLYNEKQTLFDYIAEFVFVCIDCYLQEYQREGNKEMMMILFNTCSLLIDIFVINRFPRSLSRVVLKHGHWISPRH